MKTGDFNLPLTVIMVEDPKIGGYTAFFKQFPNIIAEGDNDEDAMNNLMNAIYDVFRYQEENYKNEEINPAYRIIEKPVNFVSHVEG